MNNLPLKLEKSLENRKEFNSLRSLSSPKRLVDFFSNDYLGFSNSEFIYSEAHKVLKDRSLIQNGSTGSRLISGNHSLFEETEKLIAEYHRSESALIFNSGYDANLGFFSSVPQRGDIILYDELVHASIRDGISMSNAKAYKFEHNNVIDLQSKLKKWSNKSNETTVYVVTESVFSMDGDSPDLRAIAALIEKFNGFLVVDEAHAIGVFGEKGEGLVNHLNLENKVFATIVTYGKAMGCHGAAILGGERLKSYLINFARSFIYTTAIPPHAVATILSAYKELSKAQYIENLKENILFFRATLKEIEMEDYFIKSESAIQSCIVSGNMAVKSLAQKMEESGFNVKPILSPTVPMGKERLRFCMHTYNSKEEITSVLKVLGTFVKSSEAR
jgi:8-amino-7-oxononanoate synthase